MATIKIILEKDEKVAEVEQLLIKALDLHTSGDIHVEESFEDPAMIDLENHLKKLHKDIYSDTLNEVIELLNREY